LFVCLHGFSAAVASATALANSFAGGNNLGTTSNYKHMLKAKHFKVKSGISLFKYLVYFMRLCGFVPFMCFCGLAKKCTLGLRTYFVREACIFVMAAWSNG
jgi:hypothetical protein